MAEKHLMTRRAALLAAATGAAALAVSGCAPASPVTPEPQDAVDPAPADDLDRRVREALASLTLEQKVAQLFVVTPESLTGVGQVVAAGETTRAALARMPVAGICYFASNLQDADQTRVMLESTAAYGREANGLPLFLCVDEEGGTVSRVGGNPGFDVANVGDMRDVGATGDPERARQVAAHIGSYLADLGFNVDFAPVADIASNPDGTMGRRAFGSTADEVAPMVAAQVEGFGDAGVLCSAKHFPGIGAAAGDSHDGSISLSKTVDELRAAELVPFEAAIEKNVPLVMVGHLSLPAVTGSDVPASLSAEVVGGLLREELGYEGLVITDSLEMGAVTDTVGPDRAAVAALLAGVDLVLMPADLDAAYQGVLDAVASGELSEARVDESVERILAAKLGGIGAASDREGVR